MECELPTALASQTGIVNSCSSQANRAKPSKDSVPVSKRTAEEQSKKPESKVETAEQQFSLRIIFEQVESLGCPRRTLAQVVEQHLLSCCFGRNEKV